MQSVGLEPSTTIEQTKETKELQNSEELGFSQRLVVIWSRPMTVETVGVTQRNIKSNFLT